MHSLHVGDCLDVMRKMDANSVDLIATDPPYYKVKGESWDRQWETPELFLAWLDRVFAEFQRVLKPNGSMYVFASPRMAARVEVLAAQRFNVLNRIRWVKSAGWHNKTEKEALRSFLSPWEEIIFAEHYGSDNIAKGEAGYVAQCDDLRGFVFEPLRAYLASERDKSGVSNQQINAAWCEWKGVNSTSQTQKWFSDSCFNPPTESAYEWLRQILSRLNHGGEYLQRPYEELRQQYEELRQQYEELRRPFSVSPDVPYTDVWTFPTVNAYAGKHPTEKPLSLMRHIVTASSRPGATVLDAFAGSGTTGVACAELGRNFVGVELSPEYCRIAERRIGLVNVQPALIEAIHA